MTDEIANRAFPQGDRVVQSDHRRIGERLAWHHMPHQERGTGRLRRVGVGPTLPMMRSNRDAFA